MDDNSQSKEEDFQDAKIYYMAAMAMAIINLMIAMIVYGFPNEKGLSKLKKAKKALDYFV
jgi:hypothetical protein